MARQLAWLDRLIGLHGLAIAVIPMGRQLDLAPVNSFVLLDDRVLLETFGGEDLLSEQESATYAQVFARLQGEAATGEAARDLIAAAAARLPGE
jgi:hypothetical protein